MSAAVPDPVAPFAGPAGVGAARAFATDQVADLGRADLVDDVATVVTELVTNALLHAGGATAVDLAPTDDGVRVSVRDASRALPLLGHASDSGMTGRGMGLVRRLSSGWGVEPLADGKVVWAELNGKMADEELLSADDLLELWADESADPVEPRYRVALGQVPTDFLLAAKGHVDNLVREFNLLAVGAGDGSTEPVPSDLTFLLSIITERFADARLAIKEQALRAAHEGSDHTVLELELPLAAAEAGEEYLAALDALDVYCRAAKLVTLESAPEHRLFRHWYVGEIVRQVRAGAEDRPTSPSRSLDEVLAENPPDPDR